MFEGARGTALTWVVAAVLGTLAVTRLVGGGDGPEPVPARVEGVAAGAERPGADRGTARAAGSGSRAIYVHVAGAVRRPGLVRLEEGARTAEAIERAGGPLPRAELAGVNLAAKPIDGQQIVVPVRGRAPAAAESAGSSGDAVAAAAKPSLATATAEELEELDGIGATLAERIIEYRDSHGGFRSLDELGEVDGIGQKRLAALKEALAP